MRRGSTRPGKVKESFQPSLASMPEKKVLKKQPSIVNMDQARVESPSAMTSLRSASKSFLRSSSRVSVMLDAGRMSMANIAYVVFIFHSNTKFFSS